VKCGINTTFLTTEERKLFAFGSNLNGKLGINDDINVSLSVPT
jgi:hypothetical protein